MKRETLILKAIIGGLYIVPLTLFFYLRHTLFPLVTGKVFAFQIVVEVLFALWIGLVVFFPSYRVKLKRLDYAVLLVMGVIFLSGFSGVNLARSFWSVQGRAIGIFSLLHFTALYFVVRSVAWRINWQRYFRYLFLISLGLAGVAAWQRFFPGRLFQIISDSPSRPGSFLGNPSFLASYLIIAVFLGAWLAYVEKRKLLKITLTAGVIFEIMVIFFTGTRGAILGLSAGVLIILFQLAYLKHCDLRTNKFGGYQIIYKNIFTLILVVIFISSGIFLMTRKAEVWQSVPGLDRIATISFDDVTTHSRLIAWGTAGQVFLERPIFGWGWENFKYGFDKHYDTELLSTGLGDTFWDKPHNTFLEFLTTTGVIGFLAYLYLLGLAIRESFKKRDGFQVFGPALLVGYVIQNVFIFDTFGSYLMLFIVLAYLASNNQNEEKIIPTIRPKKISVVSVLGASAVMVLLVIFNVQVVRANNLQYHGINFILNQLPDEGVDSYRQALAVNQPYRGEIQLSYFVAVVDGISQVTFSNLDNLISEAFDSLDKAIEKNPNDYRNYVIAAQSRAKLAQIDPKYSDGIKANIEKAITLSPNRQENYYVLAEVFLGQGDTTGAYNVMKQAIELNEKIGEPHFYFGLLALGVNDSETGWREIALAKELGREPLSSQEFRVLANYYGDQEEYQQAISYYARALEISPQDTEAKLKKGIVHYYIGEDTMAKTLFEQVFEERPDFLGTPNFEALEPIFRAVGVVW